MRLTEPTKATLRYLAKKAATEKALRAGLRKKGIRVRTRLHSKAAERGASR